MYTSIYIYTYIYIGIGGTTKVHKDRLTNTADHDGPIAVREQLKCSPWQESSVASGTFHIPLSTSDKYSSPSTNARSTIYGIREQKRAL